MATSSASARFQDQTFTIRRKVFRLIGAGFEVYDSAERLVLFSEQKGFRLREDIRIYSDASKAEEVLSIQARNWVDFAAAYDVTDPTTGEKVGGLKRKGFRSLLRDQWIMMDPSDQDLGTIEEDSTMMATVRRFVPYGSFIPQKFVGTVNSQPVCEFRQHFNPIVQKITIDFSPDQLNLLDHRLGLAAGILLCAIEGRQS